MIAMLTFVLMTTSSRASSLFEHCAAHLNGQTGDLRILLDAGSHTIKTTQPYAPLDPSLLARTLNACFSVSQIREDVPGLFKLTWSAQDQLRPRYISSTVGPVFFAVTDDCTMMIGADLSLENGNAGHELLRKLIDSLESHAVTGRIEISDGHFIAERLDLDLRATRLAVRDILGHASALRALQMLQEAR